MITPDEERSLLALARRALEARVRREPAPSVEAIAGACPPCGAFVTIRCGGMLRGCLGRLTCDWPVADTVAHLAAVVCDSDPRFDPIRAAELADVDIEISFLTPEQEIASIDDIEVGTHGLIVEDRFRRGLLLPQVAPEHGWDARTFVEHACLKAGLPPDAWQHGATIQAFEAHVFGERKRGAEASARTSAV